MSIDPSLKTEGNLKTKRSVMTRAERLVALRADKRRTPKEPVLGLPKTRVKE